MTVYIGCHRAIQIVIGKTQKIDGDDGHKTTYNKITINDEDSCMAEVTVYNVLPGREIEIIDQRGGMK